MKVNDSTEISVKRIFEQHKYKIYVDKLDYEKSIEYQNIHWSSYKGYALY